MKKKPALAGFALGLEIEIVIELFALDGLQEVFAFHGGFSFLLLGKR